MIKRFGVFGISRDLRCFLRHASPGKRPMNSFIVQDHSADSFFDSREYKQPLPLYPPICCGGFNTDAVEPFGNGAITFIGS